MKNLVILLRHAHRIRCRRSELTLAAFVKWMLLFTTVAALEFFLAHRCASWLGADRNGALRVIQASVAFVAGVAFFRWSLWRSDEAFHDFLQGAPVDVRTVLTMDFVKAQLDIALFSLVAIFPVVLGCFSAVGMFTVRNVCLWWAAVSYIGCGVTLLTLAIAGVTNPEFARKINRTSGMLFLLVVGLYTNAELGRRVSMLGTFAEAESAWFKHCVAWLLRPSVAQGLYWSSLVILAPCALFGLPFSRRWLEEMHYGKGFWLFEHLPTFALGGRGGPGWTVVATWLRLNSRSGALWLGLLMGSIVPVVSLGTSGEFASKSNMPIYAVFLASFLSQSLVRRSKRDVSLEMYRALAPIEPWLYVAFEALAGAVVPGLLCVGLAIYCGLCGDVFPAVGMLFAALSISFLWSSICASERGPLLQRDGRGLLVLFLKYASGAFASLVLIGLVYLLTLGRFEVVCLLALSIFSFVLVATAILICRTARPANLTCVGSHETG